MRGRHDLRSMATKRLPRPRDPIALAKLVGDIATGQIEDVAQDNRDPRAVERGKAGGIVGGKARTDQLTRAERVELAKKAAQTRWLARKR